MFKKFLLIVCGSIVGSFIAIMVSMLCMVMFGVSIAMTMGQSKAKVKDHSILRIDLSGPIEERQSSIGGVGNLMSMLQGQQSGASLQDIERALGVAMLDEHIDGVVINCDGVSANPATLRSVRNAILNFKASKKWVYAYANGGYDQGDYYVATAADSIFVNPVGAVDVHGMASSTPYFKKVLDKVGVEMQVIRVGAYKSAVEPYMLETMSPENREQHEVYMGNIWGVMEGEMAKARKINLAQFNTYVDSMLATQPVDTLIKRHIVDAKLYRPEFENRLRTLTKVDKTDELNFVSPEELAANYDGGENKDGVIAVVYACGEIDGNSNTEEGIDSEALVDCITDLQNDDDVKGLVLRVNSPGGSAFGSEQIWKALEEFKKSGKTFTVSMGDYAASGGYYISCGANRIFADSTTITGSIGIFGMIPCAQDLVENQIGVNVEVVKTNENADCLSMGMMSKRLTPAQRQAIQNNVNEGYELFTKRCADGRKVSQDSIKAIGGGRVWDGISAKKIGLIDQFGSLADAIEWTAKKVGLKTGYYSVQCYPSAEEDMKAIFGKYMQMRATENMKREMGIFYTYYEKLQAIMHRDHILCLLPESELK
ncbi:MAG: signal peptide peptidase SppA [Bacteroidales bacterium]|nr:signal peptide peptidase SppA [Bacteroidales bacterium]